MDFKIEKKGYAPAQVNTFIAEVKRTYESALAEQKERIFELKNQLSTCEKELKAAREKSSLVSKAIMNAVAKAEEIERLSQIKYNQEILQLKAFHDKWTDYYNKILDRYPLDDQLAAAGRFNSQMTKILSRIDNNADDLTALFPVSDAERTYKKESERLSETQIGYIKVKADQTLGKDDDALLGEMIPGADPSSPIMSGNFDPIERISRYLNADIVKTAEKQSDTKPQDESGFDITAQTFAFGSSKNDDIPQKENKKTMAAASNDFADRTPLGFSFEEALNPKEDLADIMRDLGLLMDK